MHTMATGEAVFFLMAGKESPWVAHAFVRQWSVGLRLVSTVDFGSWSLCLGRGLEDLVEDLSLLTVQQHANMVGLGRVPLEMN